MDAGHALQIANAAFAKRLRRVGADDWRQPTPCTAWDVRALVNHVIGGNRRYTMLLRGGSVGEVVATRGQDHLGSDPVESFLTTAAELLTAFGEQGASVRLVHHPLGDRTGADLLRMRVLDVTVHAWDLARAATLDEALDPALVTVALTCTAHLDAGRQRGTFAPPTGPLLPGSSAQQQLLHLTGRHPTPAKETR